jgi:hypothetical protein
MNIELEKRDRVNGRVARRQPSETLGRNLTPIGRSLPG